MGANRYIIKHLGLVIITLLIGISCQEGHTKSDSYSVNGIIKNMPDSSKVVMYLDMDTILDSTLVLNEKFQFKGTVERPRRVMLRIESTRDGRMFWLENKTIHITGEKGNFYNSKVTGSQTQVEAELLMEKQDSIRKEMDKLGNLLTESNMDSLFAINEEMLDVVAEITRDFIKDHPNSYESLPALDFAMRRLGGAEAGKVFALLNKELQSTKEGKAIAKFIEINKNPKVGEKFVDFEMADIQGKTIRLSEILGKYTLLEFWSSSCGPCREFNPELVQEYELYSDKGFAILNVSLDTNKEKWLRAIEKDGLTWQNVSDLKGMQNEAALIYGVDAIPENFLIDENGTIIARYLRGDNLKNKLKELFAKNKSS
ncbi:MAG: TlpA disulfide reductase family protein [Flavobacteriaceae bacterium]